MKTHLIYSEQYDFNSLGINKIHSFDGMKFIKAWRLISSEFENEIDALWIKPDGPISDEVLLKVHSGKYLSSLNKSSTIASVIEISLTKFIPASILHNKLLKPIKLACNGTLKAAEVALSENARVMNIGGGYHHAFSTHGKGFCFFADAALSIVNSRDKGLLKADEIVLMIDLDAHRGNGFESVTENDPTVKNFDMYGFQSYPGLHDGDPDEFPYMIPLKAGMKDDVYLDVLETKLVKFLDENSEAKFVFYNAGNDILETDPLGSLKVSFEGVLKRDKFVIEQLTKRKIPTVIMTSGGYTKQSHKLIAELVKIAVQASV